MAFAFNFNGDDIKDDAASTGPVNTNAAAAASMDAGASMVEVQSHRLEEWVGTWTASHFTTSVNDVYTQHDSHCLYTIA